jgi:uncharacterized membrane protein
MTIPTTTASPWPARAAFFSAAIFTAASAGTNVLYGWQKGSDVPSSVVWASVAAAVAIVFALSWPALMRCIEARRWSAALIALVALLLAGVYSVTAALGSASGGRATAAAAEAANIDVRAREQTAYEGARAELEALKPSRPIGELEALIDAARPQCRIIVTTGSRSTVCTKASAMIAELARAKRRQELEAKIDRLAAELAAGQPVRAANSDAKVLARYLGAAGMQVQVDRLNDLLVLLAVLMIEAGGGLSLAIGMALGEDRPNILAKGFENAPNTTPEHTEHPENQQRAPAFSLAVQEPEILTLLRRAGGLLRTTTRRLGDQLGRPAATVHGELRRLASEGLITLNADRRGTCIALAGS